MSCVAFIKFAPIFTGDFYDPRRNRAGRNMYERLRSHLASRRCRSWWITVTTGRSGGSTRCTAGIWSTACGTSLEQRSLESRLAGCRKHETKASLGFHALHRRSYGEAETVADALGKEVSVLVGKKPFEPLAHVLMIERAAAADSPSDAAAAGAPRSAGEVLYSRPETIIRRPGIGQVLGVR